MSPKTIPVSPFDLIIFGATGDLARRKLLPALFNRMLAGQFPEKVRIIGAARANLSKQEFQAMAREALESFATDHAAAPVQLGAFLDLLTYIPINIDKSEGWQELETTLNASTNNIRVFYLSVSPSLFPKLAEEIAKLPSNASETRIVIEKPLGHDLDSARQLNHQLATHFNEKQIYRIDHYLGKETVQNLMALRFANALFEPVWNAHHVDHVQISVAENLGVEGRGGYYDNSGAMRDMVQNHLLQLLCLTAMEPPSRFEADAVRDEKLKVIRALRPIGSKEVRDVVVRGQYGESSEAPHYREAAGNPESQTESYVALKVEVENWRWAGTPFYLRTGKKLRARLSEIAVVFKDTPHSIFPADAGPCPPNALIIRLQPNEAITLRMNIKDPGTGGMRIVDVPLDMSFADKLGLSANDMPDAYERLIMDVVRGDQTLFMRGDEVEAAWAWIDPILSAWKDSPSVPDTYDPGSSGPDDALMLLHRDGRKWREISPQ